MKTSERSTGKPDPNRVGDLIQLVRWTLGSQERSKNMRGLLFVVGGFTTVIASELAALGATSVASTLCGVALGLGCRSRRRPR